MANQKGFDGKRSSNWKLIKTYVRPFMFQEISSFLITLSIEKILAQNFTVSKLVKCLLKKKQGRSTFIEAFCKYLFFHTLHSSYSRQYLEMSLFTKNIMCLLKVTWGNKYISPRTLQWLRLPEPSNVISIQNSISMQTSDTYSISFILECVTIYYAT